MKFIHYTFLLLSCFAIGCFTPSSVYQTSSSPVKFKFEEGSKVIKKTYCTSLEKTKDGKFIFKRYYPTTSVMTEQIGFWDEEMTVRDGKTIKRYDDGKLRSLFTYVKNIKEGQAIEGSYTGNYKNGERFGNWQMFYENVKILSTNYNEKGELHGQDTSWTKEGKLAAIRMYKNNEKVKEEVFIEKTMTPEFQVVEKMPLFPSEKCSKIESDSLKKMCADNVMLKHIYSNIKYPTFARVNGIEGTALLSFVVEKDGSIAQIKVLNGVCDEIKAECIRVINSFPTWQPGYQRGEPVRVQFNLPINFRLS